MRVVLVCELTRLEREIAKEGTLDSVRRNYEKDVFSTDLSSPHGEYQSEKNEVLRFLLAAGANVVECPRHEAQGFIFRDDDLVVVLGDDGALVNIAKLLGRQKVVTIGTATKWCSRMMKFTVKTFGKEVMRLVRKEGETLSVSIARAETSLGHTLEAVNDFFVGRADLRSSRYALLDEEFFVEQVSSGVIVSTGTGSTGWEKSARRMDDGYVEREPDDEYLVVTTRELCHGDDLGVLEDVSEVTIRSSDNDTRVVADGVLLDSAMLLLPAGATVVMTASYRSVQILL